ncbi:hypothetical protein [uncultured Acinetobacter sp.]|nr:hypothetical protein [uncultured Acinetobacter sp.]
MVFIKAPSGTQCWNGLYINFDSWGSALPISVCK